MEESDLKIADSELEDNDPIANPMRTIQNYILVA